MDADKLKKLIIVGVLIAIALSYGYNLKTRTIQGQLPKSDSVIDQLKAKHCAGPTPVTDKQCDELIDQASLQSFSKLARRESDKLILKISEGEPIFRQNVTEPPEKAISFFLYHHYTRENLFLLRASFWEGAGYALIDSITGEEYFVFRDPIFNKDSSQFVTASLDLESRYNPNGIELWQKDGNKWLQVFNRNFESIGFKNPRWINESKITFDKYILENGKAEHAGFGHLLQDGKTWIVQ